MQDKEFKLEVNTELGIAAAVELFHKRAKDAGWYSDVTTGAPKDRNIPEMMALMHSEISEALEAYRKSLNDDKLPHRSGVEVELADLLIRVFDLAGYMSLDLAGAVIEKGRYNTSRLDHKLENRAKEGGKKF